MAQRQTSKAKAAGISEAKGGCSLVDDSQFSCVLAALSSQVALFFFPILLADQECRVMGLPSPWLAQVADGKIKKSAKQRNLQHGLSYCYQG